MNRSRVIAILIFTFVAEVFVSVFLMNSVRYSGEDTVKINECVRSVENEYGNEDAYSRVLDYTVLDSEGVVVFETKDKLPSSINEAIAGHCLILDYETISGNTGKIIFENSIGESLKFYKNVFLIVLIILILIQLIVITFWFIYIKIKITDPFKKLNSFATRVAEGNLDLPLDMDRGHVFGEFTEAFDLMRSELKKAKQAERKANEEKKEIVAKLSHDIKTPVASIKSTSEIGLVTAENDHDKKLYKQINEKSDQITTLVNNLFESSVKEITEIPVSPSEYSSSVIRDLILNSDYLNKTKEYVVPECKIYIDKLRLQQALDNIFVNSYKYAGTEILIDIVVDDEYLIIDITDMGPGVSDEEIPLLTKKYMRGENAEGKEGAGLGLYLTNYYIEQMDGHMEIVNGHPGLSIKLYLRNI